MKTPAKLVWSLLGAIAFAFAAAWWIYTPNKSFDFGWHSNRSEMRAAKNDARRKEIWAAYQQSADEAYRHARDTTLNSADRLVGIELQLTLLRADLEKQHALSELGAIRTP